MTFFVMILMLAIGFLAGIIFTVGFVAYLESKPPVQEKPVPNSDDRYMSEINTERGIAYHARRD